MAGTHQNDLQQKGMQSTYLAAQKKLRDKFMKQPLTRKEFFEFLQGAFALEAKVNGQFNFLLDNVTGLREKYEEALAKGKAEKAAKEAEANAAAAIG